jgi:2-keto-4-pentenoate hydratase/2-oxohepta-3-ene-1,7-dioic acid hydratase in catechol pathway
MRFATLATPHGPRLALADGDTFIDLHDSDPALPDNLRDLLDSGPVGLENVRQVLNRPKAVRYPLNSVAHLPPIPNPRKIVCLGRNYREHAAETGSAVPKEPILFSKYPSALIGHGADIVLPPVSHEVDFEAELVVVIGKRGRPKSPQEALAHVAGYTIGNDISARDWQLKKDGKQWMVGKTFDTFAPTGPTVVTADEIPDPQRLDILLLLNGQTMQQSNTEHMIFPVREILVYLAQIFTLEPGDLIFTGTPPGVGFARQPPIFLKAGDVVEVEIEGIGRLRNAVVQG